LLFSIVYVGHVPIRSFAGTIYV